MPLSHKAETLAPGFELLSYYDEDSAYDQPVNVALVADTPYGRVIVRYISSTLEVSGEFRSPTAPRLGALNLSGYAVQLESPRLYWCHMWHLYLDSGKRVSDRLTSHITRAIVDALDAVICRHLDALRVASDIVGEYARLETLDRQIADLQRERAALQARLSARTDARPYTTKPSTPEQVDDQAVDTLLNRCLE